jgi:hypothetical protein
LYIRSFYAAQPGLVRLWLRRRGIARADCGGGLVDSLGAARPWLQLPPWCGKIKRCGGCSEFQKTEYKLQKIWYNIYRTWMRVQIHYSRHSAEESETTMNNKKMLKTLIGSLEIVNAYIMTNRDVLDADDLARYEVTRDNLIEIIAHLVKTED